MKKLPQIIKNILKLLTSHPYLTIISLGLLVYVKTFFFNYTYLDDNVLILNNYQFLKNLSFIPKSFITEVFHSPQAGAAYYRPMLTVSFILDAQIGGINPFIYHLSNLLIHLTATSLLYLLLTKLSSSKNYLLPLFLSLIFLTHPALSQAIAWIPGRNDSLLAIFTLLSFIFLINSTKQNRLHPYIYHFLFFLLALFTKESALVIPLLSLFYITFIAQPKPKLDHYLTLILGWTITLLPWFLLRKIALSQNPINYSLSSITQSIFTNLPALPQFIGKIFLPFNLSVLPIIQDTSFTYGIISIIILFFLLLIPLISSPKLTRKKNILLTLFGTGWFLSFLLPSFIRPNLTYTADFIEHRLYLPLIGLLLIFSQTYRGKINIKKIKLPLTFSFLFIISLFTIINLNHTPVFKNRLSFWQNAVINSPHHPLAHRNLGAMYYLDNQPDKAKPEFEKSLQLNSQEQMAHNNLGLIYLDKKEYQLAEQEFFQELEINPISDLAHFNLGLLYYHTNQKTEAEEYWLKTLTINPYHPSAYQNLIALYQETKQTEKIQQLHNLYSNR